VLAVLLLAACGSGGNSQEPEDLPGDVADVTPDIPEFDVPPELSEEVAEIVDVLDVKDVADVPRIDEVDEKIEEPDCLDCEDEISCNHVCEEDTDCLGVFPGETTTCVLERCLWDAGCGSFQCQLKRKLGCCDSNQDCKDSNACTLNERCQSDNTCTYDWDSENPACCINQSIRSLSFNDGFLPPSSKLQIVDYNPSDTVTWTVAEDPCGPGKSIYLGDPQCHTYFTGQLHECQPVADISCTPANADIVCPTAQCADSGKCEPSFKPGLVRVDAILPELILPANALISVKFRLWADSEPGIPGEPFPSDILKLIVTIGGVEQEVAYTTEKHKSTQGSCVQIAADLSIYAGLAIDLKFAFDTLDFVDNFYQGLYLDDIHVLTYCSTCSGLVECEDNDPCTVDSCMVFANKQTGTGFCDNTKQDPYCWPCGDLVDCAGHGPHPEDPFCWPGVCTPAGTCRYDPNPQCCNSQALEVFWRTGFESGTLGAVWQLQDDGTPVKWQLRDGAGAPESGVPHSDTFGLYYGNPSTGTYDCGTVQCTGWARTPFVDLTDVDPTAFVKLSFFLKLSTEFDDIPQEDYPANNAHTSGIDVLYVEAVRQNGAVVEVWNSDVVFGSTHGQFVQAFADLSAFKGEQVALRFRFNTGVVVPANNNYGGVWVDELQVESVCHGVCSADSQCPQGGDCTRPVCSGGQCGTEEIPGCCTQSFNTSCNDGDPCTVDVCHFASKTCVHTFSTDPGCCTPYESVYQTDFEGGGSGWFTPWSGPACGDGFCAATETCLTCPQDCLACPVSWRVSDLRSASGTKALYFGNPLTFSYQDGAKRVFGSSMSPAIQLPPFGIPKVSFQLWLDTEHSATHQSFVEPNEFDNLNLYIETATNPVNPQWSAPRLIWNSMVWELKGSTFSPNDGVPVWKKVEVGINQADVLGKVVRFRFEFDSSEGSANDYEGAYVDDFRVGTVCSSSYTCTSSFECPEATPSDPHCSMESCTGGACTSSANPMKNGCCEQETLAGGTFDFDGPCSMESWSANPPTATVKWQAHNHQNHTSGGQCSLYFGNGSTLTYNSPGAAVGGVATSPTVKVTGNSKIEVSFWMWMDIQDLAFWLDILSVKVDYAATATMAPGGADVTIWSKPCSPVEDLECSTIPASVPCDFLGCKAIPQSQWTYYSLILDFTTGPFLAWPWSIFPDQYLVLKFDFRSWDEMNNGGKGIFIDDVRFRTVCQ
jgi:hypothetical protein